jgi:histidine triad (HIT) family protein
MSLAGAYDDQNVFARILRGELPCVKVFEDEVALAFMDIMPQASGHVLVIPRTVRARNFLDLDPAMVGAFMERVQTVSRAVVDALAPDGVTLVQFNGAPAGQTVFHLHFHIIPRRDGDTVAGHGTAPIADRDALEALAVRIRAALPR